MKAGLVSVVEEIIQNIKRKIYTLYNVSIKPRPGYQFVLKTFGLREYLLGNFAMLYYDRVRTCLRGLKNMEVSLVEIPIQTQISTNFPPRIKRDRYDVYKGNIKQIDWQALENVPLLFWHMP